MIKIRTETDKQLIARGRRSNFVFSKLDWLDEIGELGITHAGELIIALAFGNLFGLMVYYAL